MKNVTMNKGFTLIELLVVVAIISILAVLVVAGIRQAPENPEVKDCIADKLEELDKKGEIVGWSKKSEIETHCQYLNEYK